MAFALVVGSLSSGATAPTRSLVVLSVDPYVNPDSYHRTEVEPDSYSFGSTIVATFQVARNDQEGAANIGWATSRDDGATWTNGFLPGITGHGDPPGPYDRAADPSVARDVAHDVWLISSLALRCCPLGGDVLVNRSTDGGLTWGLPIQVDGTLQSPGSNKPWITCDNWPQSPYRGRCYVEWDDAFAENQLFMATSTDGGLTWFGAGVPSSSGTAGQPVVQPNGRVVVPVPSVSGPLQSFVSEDGGVTYQGPFPISSVQWHRVAGNLRAGPLPSAEVDGAGRVYLVWQDCRFRSECAANDIVMTTTTDGRNWTPVVRIPIDPVSSPADHFLPGLAVDTDTAGASASLGLAYYFYPQRSCSPSTCRLSVGYTSSSDGGATWSEPVLIGGPFRNTWFPLATYGYMVGDYISTSWSGQDRAFPIFAAALPSECSFEVFRSCRQTIVTVAGGLPPSES